MRVQVASNEEDYLEYIRFFFRQSPGGIRILQRNDRMLWEVVILMPVLVGAVLVLAGRMQQALFMSGAILVCLAAMYPLLRRMTRKSIEKNSLTVLRSDPEALALSRGVMEITPEYFSRESELAYSRIAWKAVKEVYETPTHLFLFFGSVLGTVTIPLRCFDSPQDAAAFAVAARKYADEARATAKAQS